MSIKVTALINERKEWKSLFAIFIFSPFFWWKDFKLLHELGSPVHLIPGLILLTQEHNLIETGIWR